MIDDELNTLLTAIRNKIGDSGKMLVVVDACHSGDSSRGQDDEIVRGVKEEFGGMVPTGIKNRFFCAGCSILGQLSIVPAR